MASSIIGVPIDNGTLTASEDSGETVVNMLRKAAGDAYISADGAAPIITYDLDAPTDVIMVGVLFVNAAAGTTIQILTADSEPELTSGPDYDSGVVNFHHATTFAEHDRQHHIVFPNVTTRWVRLIFSHTGTLRIGRLFVSSKLQPSQNLKQTFSLGITEDARIVKTESSEYAGSGLITRALSVVFRLKTATKRLLQSVINERGFSQEVLLVMNPDDPDGFMDEALYGRISDASVNHVVSTGTNTDIFEIPLTVSEFEKP